MKKKLFIFALVATLMINIFTKANAEQYVLACKIKISAVHMLTNKVLRTYMIDTRITYNRGTHHIKLNEIYAYASQFDQRAQFVTKGEGTCSEIKINRKPLF